METTNLSKIRRDKMLKTINEIKKSISDEETINNLSMIENELLKRKYGLIWEEHEERADIELKTQIPTFIEVKDKEIVSSLENKFNFLLEGDNLHSLYLLEKTHKGKIDVIYIDPPYNTGNNDFIYNDTFIDSEDGYRHSKWLSFMEKRLIKAKDLLKQTGICFISIDDIEISQLKLLCDTIFGESNFIACCPRIAKRTSNKGNYFKLTKDYVLVYAKSLKNIDWKFGADNKININDFKYEDERGKYKKNGASLYQPSLDSRPNQRYWIECPDGSLIIPPGTAFPEKLEDAAFVKPLSNKDKVWRWSYETYLKNKDLLIFTKASSTCPLIDSEGNPSKWNIYDKVYLEDKTDSSLLPEDVIYDYVNSQGTKEIMQLGLNFSFAKPVGLIKYLIKLCMLPKDIIVLDFFAGSGTTAQAVLELNKEDNGNRQFILCTNNENNICEDITYPRIKSVIEGCGKYTPILSNLKYYKISYILKMNTEKEVLHNNLIINIKNLIQLENGIKVDDSKIRVYLDEKELDKFTVTSKELDECDKVYISSDIILTSEQEKTFKDKNIKMYIMPNYYFEAELCN